MFAIVALGAGPALVPCHAGSQDPAPAAKPTAPAPQTESQSAAAAPSDPRLLSIFSPLPDQDEWRRWIARDKRLKFTVRTATDARRLLAQEKVSPQRRAVAWMAIGCGRDVAERVETEEMALKGTGIERCAAILALGEMGASVEDTLFGLLASPGPGVGECALMALLRTERASSRRRVDEIANDPQDPLAAAAANLLVFNLDVESSTPGRASALLLQLRWAAARHFGLVDDQAWPVLVVRSLCLDTDFLHEVVVRAASSLRRPGVKDALLMELLSGTGPGRLRAAVHGMPREVTQLVENDLWQPKDAAEWSILLDEIAVRDLEPLTVELLTRAADVPSIHYRAVALLARTDGADIAGLIDAEFSNLSPEEQVYACDAMASSGDAGWMKRIEVLRTDDDPRVRAAALIASARLGDKDASSALADALRKATHDDHKVVVAEMSRVVHDPLVAVMLEEELPNLKGDEAVDVATVLCLEGRLPVRTIVRDALGAEPAPSGARGARLVQALRRHGTPEDGDILRQLFPREDDVEMNIELGLSLIGLDEPLALPVLSAAVWHLDWQTSILAAGVLADVAGIGNLRALLTRPPREATSNDIRRVGYAVGLWGGLAQVEELARDVRYNSGDPALQGALLGALSARTQ
jgi:HEAT repeat protein